MSDRSLRLLERRAAQGDLEAGARLLRERVRTGGTSVEGIRLAAFCGDRAAEQVLGATSAPTDFVPWCEALALWGPGVCVRAAIVCVDHLESAWRDAPEGWLFRSLNQELLNEFECPCVHHERLLRRWQRRARKTLRRLRLHRTWGLAGRREALALRCLLEAATAALSSPRQAEVHGRAALRAAAGALAVDGDRAEAEAEVRRWVEVALRAWALAD